MKLLRRLTHVLILAVLACAGSPSSNPTTTPTPPVSEGLYPGDAIQVEIWQEEDLSGEFNVDQRGNVVLPLLGERTVTGISGSELERRLAEEYRGFLENPSVRVTVLRRIAIFGEIRDPGLYLVDATVTLRDALAMAGGILPSGNRDHVRLRRHGEVLVANLDLDQIVAETPIQSGDQIEVGQERWMVRNRSLLMAFFGAVTTLLTAFILRG
jgi:polysaccharide export outer membrane protein